MTAAVYSRHEEHAHALTHGFGTIASLLGLPLLISTARESGDALQLLGSLLFGASLVLLYGASTAYHAARPGPLKRRLKALDHAAIYALIAGTYSPFMLVTFRDSFGPLLLVVLWSMAFAGAVFKLFYAGRFEKLSLSIYLGMGWAIIVVAKPVYEALPATGLWLMAAGGVAYTLGVVFYVWRSLRYHHAIWHLFVLTGSVFHYFAVLLYAN